jgi:hypothetical protein
LSKSGAEEESKKGEMTFAEAQGEKAAIKFLMSEAQNFP